MGTYNIAQMVEHLTSNDGVHGSIPCVGASQSLALAGSDAEAQKRNVDKFFHLKANHVEKGTSCTKSSVCLPRTRDGTGAVSQCGILRTDAAVWRQKFMITTSRSAVAAFQRCNRLRYWQYEAPNNTPTPGWESRKLAIPLVTGIYVHEGLAKALTGMSASEAASHAKASYLEEVTARGLAVEEGTDEASVVDEQAAHVEALVLAWCRVRLPVWQKDFEVVAVEQEDRVALSDDVVLAVRADAIVRRKADGRMFVVNFKTASQCDERWMRQWETDMQLMTELLAAEHRYAQPFCGVIIEGLVKGPRVGVDQWLKEVRGDDATDKVHAYIDRSRLLYGYKCDADPPLTPLQYQWEGTTRKGWYKFRTWKETSFVSKSYGEKGVADMSALEYWVSWLPEEVVEQQFAIVPPILRDASRIESCVRQIVAMEQNIRLGMDTVRAGITMGYGVEGSLDVHFPQNGHSCHWPGRCACYDLCWSPGIDTDPSSLYRPRIDHHALTNVEVK